MNFLAKSQPLLLRQNKMSIHDLIIHKRDYDFAVNRFTRMAEHLIAISGREIDIPEPVFDEQNRSISFEFTDTRVECRFSYNRGNTILTYGFIKIDEIDRKIFHETSRQFVNNTGEILVEKCGSGTGYKINEDEGQNTFFFPRIFGALEDAWQYQDSEDPIPQADPD